MLQPIRTASTVERIVRNSILAAMVLGFAAYSFYDGYVGYPADNLEKARTDLPAEVQERATINPAVWQASARQIEKGMAFKEVVERLGEPAYEAADTARVWKAWWFGPGGMLVVRRDAAGYVVRPPEWRNGKHTETDLQTQKLMGVVLGPLGLILLGRVLWMAVRGAKFSEAGLQPSGRPLIPFDAMTGWDTSEYKKKGRIRLTYLLDGQEDDYVLDDYKLRAFPQIVAEICRRRGFENPIKQDATSPPAPGDEPRAS